MPPPPVVWVFRALLGAAVVAIISASYEVKVGNFHITGPAAQIIFMGCAVSTQSGKGIHLRQRARAFVVSDGTKRMAHVFGDFGKGGDLVKTHVVQGLIGI